MAHILALSSWVANGHVGLSAAAPVLQALGHRVTQLPTVQLSNHPGFEQIAGNRTDPDMLRAMFGALDRNGLINDVDTILTGYLPSAAHVDVAVDLIEHFKGQDVRVVVDPVLGDLPKGLYIAAEAAAALRDRLVPIADVLTPNAFELSWLTGCPTEKLDAAADAAAALEMRAPFGEVLVTSAPFEGNRTGVLSVSPNGLVSFQTQRVPETHAVPHGVGDVFSALVAAGLPPGAALGHLHTIIAHSLDAPHLRISETTHLWTKAAPVKARPHAPLTGTDETR